MRADEQALRELHAAHAPCVRAFALGATGDRQVAEEIVQDTFVHAWRAADRFDPRRAGVRTWLLAIARNLVIDHHRRQAVRPAVPMPDNVLDVAPAMPSDVDRVVEVADVVAALRRLSPEHREVIVVVHLDGASVREAAARLGVPEGTVKSRLYYGLRALRLALRDGEETGDR